MSVSSNSAGLKAKLLRVALVVSAGALSGCPQVLSDDFSVGNPPLAASGGGRAGSSGIGGTVHSGSTATSDNGGGPNKTDVATGGVSSIADVGGATSSSNGGAPPGIGGLSADTAETAWSPGGHPATTTNRSDSIGGSSDSGGSPSAAGTSMSGGTSATGGSPLNAGAPARAGAAGSGGTSASTTAASGGAQSVEIGDCSNMVTLTEPLLVDFDDWDGTADLHRWRFTYGGTGAVGPISGTFDEYDDGTGNYVLEMDTGAASTKYAPCASNPAASSWGGGLRFSLHCLDASAYKGLSFWIKGTSPATTIDISLGFEVGTNLDDGSASYRYVIPSQWKQVRLAFSSFNGWDTAPPGKRIDRIAFSSQLNYPNGKPVPGSFQICVDQIAFYSN